MRLKYQKGYLLEALVWVLGITLLAFMEPGQKHLISFCPFSWLLENGCPGCGLGHAIAYIFRGEWQTSWEAHPLAVPALLILGHRVIKLLRLYFTIRTIHTYIKPTHG